ncbi:AAA family ATPase [Vagococcus coleopterorum]|uniref:AAA family ATPase n=1 Tax=Vagococcus coleopterorum TaxID=2714946 RepID=A0A6G8ALA9_9ENTE|nr:AAA family ATPase [Vagococcus coleopterorum]QIL45713.1 AAA family ATPase [Vagococcus coleopterorum]
MKIEKLEIVGFGQWRQQIFELGEEVTLFFGDNEAGKTTIYHFIQTILFGFPTKRGAVRDYTPRDGGSYGGHIWVNHPQFGQAKISRFKDVNKHQATVQIMTEPDMVISVAEFLAPLTEEVFKEVYTLEQGQLLNIKNLDETKLQELLLVVGLAGSKQVIEQQEEWQKAQQELYKKTGRNPKLNQLVLSYRELTEKIQLKEKAESSYQENKEELEIAEADFVKNQQLSQELETKKMLQEQQLDHYGLLEEYRYQVKQLNETATLELSQDEVTQLQELNFQINQLADQKAHYQQLKQSAFAQGTLSPAVAFYLEEEQDIQRLLNQRVSVEKELSKLESLEEQLREKEAAVQELSEGNPNWQAQPIPSQLESKLADLAEDERHFSYEQQQATAEFARLVEQGKHYQEQQVKRQRKLQRLWLFPGLIALVGVAFYWLNQQWMLAVFGLAAVVSGLIAVVIYRRINSGAGTLGAVTLTQLSAAQDKKKLADSRWTSILTTKEQLAADYGFDINQTVKEWLYQLPLRQHLATLVSERTSLLSKKTASQVQLAKIETAFIKLKDWIPSGQDIGSKFQNLAEFSATQIQQLKTLEQVSQSQQWQQPLALIEAKEKQMAQTLAKVHPQLSVANHAEVLAEQLSNHESQQELRQLSAKLAPYFELDNDASYNQVQLRSDYQDLSQRYRAIQSELGELDETIRHLRFAIKQAESDGSLASLYQEQAALEDELRELSSDWASLQLSSVVADDVLNQISSQRVPALLKTTSLLLNRLTLGTYHRCDLVNDELLIFNREGVCYHLSELSTGTRDQLYLAVRLAFIELHQGTNIAPLIIDDGWLHYDQARKIALFNVLVEISAVVQVICLTSDQELLNFAESEKIVVEHL